MSEDNFKLDFIGIGAQKAATTWMYNCLIEHPEVCGPEEKELTFFRKKHTGPFQPNKILGQAPVEKYGFGEYKKYFSRCSKDKIIGEYSTSYLYYPECPRLIQEHLPDIKLIACLRNPIDRAYSQYNHVVHNKNRNNLPFEEALKEAPRIIERGMYYKQLKRYYDNFPEDNILVLIYDQISSDPVDFIQQIYKFLEVEAGFEPSLAQTRINPRRDRMNPVLKYLHTKGTPLLRKTALGRKIKQSPIVKKLFYYLERKTARKEGNINPEFRKKLRDVYKEDINKLEQLIDKDLSHWKNHEKE